VIDELPLASRWWSEGVDPAQLANALRHGGRWGLPSHGAIAV
jgi:hypothetical protein